MTSSASLPTREKLRDLDEWLTRDTAVGIPKAFTEAMQSFLTAMGYDDNTLMRSHLESAKKELAAAVHEVVARRLGWPTRMSERCRQIKHLMRDVPRENWDELGAEVEARFDEMLKVLSELRDGPVRLLLSHGCEIDNAGLLTSDIQELHLLRKSILESWPWSSRELPAVNREMVAASMAALARGETGEPIEDLIRRLGGTPKA
jgi:hypothetical protein